MTIKFNVQVTQVTDTFKSELRQSLTQILSNSPGMRVEKERSIEKLLSPAGEDRMLTVLRRLNYQKYACTKAPDDTIYFLGKTKDLIVDIDHHGKYNLGPYYVAISKTDFINSQNTNVHMFPDYNPRTPHRHLHHYAHYPLQEPFGPNDPNNISQINPLMAEPRTCWAEIGQPYLHAIHDANIVEAFRVLYIFLTRLNFASPLDQRWVTEAIANGVRL